MTMETTDVQVIEKYPRCMNCALDIMDGTGYRLFKLIEETPAPSKTAIIGTRWYIVCVTCGTDVNISKVALSLFKEKPDYIIIPTQPALELEEVIE